MPTRSPGEKFRRIGTSVADGALPYPATPVPYPLGATVSMQPCQHNVPARTQPEASRQIHSEAKLAIFAGKGQGCAAGEHRFEAA